MRIVGYIPESKPKEVKEATETKEVKKTTKKSKD